MSRTQGYSIKFYEGPHFLMTGTQGPGAFEIVIWVWEKKQFLLFLNIYLVTEIQFISNRKWISWKQNIKRVFRVRKDVIYCFSIFTGHFTTLGRSDMARGTPFGYPRSMLSVCAIDKPELRIEPTALFFFSCSVKCSYATVECHSRGSAGSKEIRHSELAGPRRAGGKRCRCLFCRHQLPAAWEVCFPAEPPGNPGKVLPG